MLQLLTHEPNGLNEGDWKSFFKDIDPHNVATQ